MEMTDAVIKQKIFTALEEPAVPQAVVERAVDRINAVTAGKAAENELAGLQNGTSAQRKTELAAAAVTGRLMSVRRPAENVTSAAMTQQLLANKRFCELTSGDPVKLAHDIRSGELIKKLTQPELRKNNISPVTAKTDVREEVTARDPLSL